jgi:hypothetical protein
MSDTIVQGQSLKVSKLRPKHSQKRPKNNTFLRLEKVSDAGA